MGRFASGLRSAVAPFLLSCALGTSGMVGCGSNDKHDKTSDSAQANSGVPSAAEALSQHYVEVTFEAPAHAAAERAASYTIHDAKGRPLVVQDVQLASDRRSAVLVTAPQQNVTYTLQLDTSGQKQQTSTPGDTSAAVAVSRAALTEVVNFDGSSTSEPYLQSAVPLSNTSLLLSFSQPIEASTGTNPAFYRIMSASAEDSGVAIGELQVLGATLGDDGTTVTLKTSAQQGIRYQVEVSNVRGTGAGRLRINPLRDSAGFFGMARDDRYPPELTRADAPSSRSLLVSFSEPISNAALDPANSYLIARGEVVLPAQVDAGPDMVTTVAQATPLSGRASKSAAWTQVSGPGTATFADATSPTTRATFSAPGVYVLRLGVDDGTLTVGDELTIEVDLGGSVAHLETVSGAASNASSVVSASLAAGSGPQLYLAAITAHSRQAVQSVRGLGLTWSRVRAQCPDDSSVYWPFGADSEPGLELWSAYGTPTGAGAVTATLLAEADRVTLAVSRYSGVDPTRPYAALTNGNASGPGDACSNGGVESRAWESRVPPTAAPSRIYAAAAIGPRASTPGANVEERLERHQGTGNTQSGITVVDGVSQGVGTQTVGGRLDGDYAWVALGVELVPYRAPRVSVGADKVLATGTPLVLDGVVSDSSGALPAGTSVRWSVASHTGAGTVSFEAASAAHTRATFSAPGTYVLRMSATVGPFTVSDEQVVLVAEPDVVIRGAEAQAVNTQVLLSTMPIEAGQAYTLIVDGLTDQNGNTIELARGATPFVFEGEPETSVGELPPALRGAISTSNTSVTLQFSKPMSDSVLNASNYAIVQVNVNSEVGALGVRSAAFLGADRKAVVLTTRSQNEVTYQITAVNVTDLTGNVLAAPVVSNGVLVDPTRATFPGTPPSGADIVDSDGDGLTDNLEQSGWLVTVTQTDGSKLTRQVTSNAGDPALPSDDPSNVLARDTDQDGLSDRLERLLGSDPRQADTDGDSLSDDEEYNTLFSNQNSTDSDSDGIDDYLEVEYFKTNVLVADSDGDGYADGDELFGQSRDPRVADLPEHRLEIGKVTLRIDERFTYTNDEGQTTSQSSSTTSTLATGESRSTVKMDGTTRSESGGAEFGLDTCQDGCAYFDWQVFANRLFAKAHAEGGREVLDQTDVTSARDAQEAFESSLAKGAEFSASSSVSRQIVGASVQVEVTLMNPSDVAISLSNLELTLRSTDPEDASALVPIATLVPEGATLTGNGTVFNIGPGETRGPVLFTNTTVFPNLVEALMQSPRGFSTSVANYDLTTGDGRNFAFGMQTVRERTAGVLFDFGDGKVSERRAITAGVLNRPRDERLCASSGDHPNGACESDADCGTSTPCAGGSIVGGYVGFSGTGVAPGIPLDFLLRDALAMRRTSPRTVLAGSNGRADTRASGDDVQVAAFGSTGLAPGSIVIAPGKNLVLDSVSAGDDSVETEPDGVRAGADSTVNSVARGDDVQLVPVGTRGIPDDVVVIGAGDDGVLDTVLRGDDVADVVTGYEVAHTCNADTPFAILAGQNGVVETRASTGTCVIAFAPAVRGQSCSANLDCGRDSLSTSLGSCDNTDVQARALNASGLPANTAVITSGSDNFVASVPAGDDVLLAPGVPCVVDQDCRASGVSATGSCSGPDKVVRVEQRRDGQYRRSWTLVLSDDVPFQTDFGRIRVKAGDQIGLKFLQDIDRDGLNSEVEFLAGSSDFKRDTDDDTLDDFAEVRVGWTVGVVGSVLRKVYPDPRVSDSDVDGLGDREEFDIRPTRCACSATGPFELVGNTGTPCSTSSECGTGLCVDAAACSAEAFIRGEGCPVCASDATLARTDPRRADSDADRVSDFEEAFGYLTGAGVMSPTFAQVALAGNNRRADTLACPQNRCVGEPNKHCVSNGDCAGRQCRFPVPCDDVQVVPVGTGGLDANTVVVAPGKRLTLSSGVAGSYIPLDSALGGDDQVLSATTSAVRSRLLGDDVAFVGENELAYTGGLGEYTCSDGSRFTPVLGNQAVAQRFPMCGVIKPGVDGVLQSQPAGAEVLVPAGFGQRREFTDPLNPDSDLDDVRDGFERVLGSSPSDPSDTGIASDRDRDGLADRQESSGWLVTVWPVVGSATLRTVASNPHVPDTDLDGIPDYGERNMPCNDAPGAVCATDPTSADTDGDGLRDVDELSTAKLDQLESFEGYFAAYSFDGSRSAHHGTNPNNADTDGDDLSDYDELFRDFTVRLADGTMRVVRTNPLMVDTDRDGASDYAERTRSEPTDPTDPDTDDDGKNDGVEINQGSDPLVPDVRVTVRVRRIDVDTIQDPGGTEDGEFAWWVLLDAPSIDSPPYRLSHAWDADSSQFAHQYIDPDLNCANVRLDPARHHTIHLQNSYSFTLKKGQTFSMYGLIAELDSNQGSDCGDWPNYMPSHLTSQCYTRFSETYSFSDLSFGERGESIAVNPVDANAAGGDRCSWSMAVEISVQ